MALALLLAIGGWLLIYSAIKNVSVVALVAGVFRP